MKKLLYNRISVISYLFFVFSFQLLFVNSSYANENEEVKSIHEVVIKTGYKNTSLNDVFADIESKTDFFFTFDNEDSFLKMFFSKPEGKNSVAALLKEISLASKLAFQQTNNNISVRKQSIKEENETPLVIIADAINVSGTITSSFDNLGIPGVSILVKGSSLGTISDVDGKYNINITNDRSVLVFSSIGYIDQEVSVKNRTVIDVIMEEDLKKLDEFVVIGYGVQKKVNVIGSVATITSKELTSSPVPNISNALAGRLPGLLVQQRSGEPGLNEASLLVRGNSTLGNNSPLVVIDGIQGRDLNSLNPNDVESITVLKDASAAIYGARAANGVILVTTKKGTAGSPPSFNYSFYEGVLSPTNLPEMANSWEYAEMIREVELYRGNDENNMTFTEEDIENYRSGTRPWTHPNTKWYDEALANNSRIGSHTFSVNGGGSDVNYYVSFGSMNEEGIYKNSGTSFNRINLKGRIDIKVNEFFDVGIDINGAKGDRESSVKSSGNIFTSIVRNYPYRHAVFPGTDKPGPDIEYGDQPIVTPSLAPGFNNDVTYRSNNLLFGTFRIPGIENLSIDASYSFDKYVKKRKVFEKPYTLYAFDKASYEAAGNSGVENGEDFLIPYRAGTISEPMLTDYYDDTENNSLNIKMAYADTFGKNHNLSAFVAYENATYEGQGINAFRRFFNSDKLPYLFAGGDPEKDNGGWVDIDARVNFISRVNYDFKDRFLFQLGFRRDGSLRFSKESGRWGNFPSILAGWRVSEHVWWKDNLPTINEFKLKASWAQMGNDLVEPFQYLSSYNFGKGILLGSNAIYSQALYQSGAPNPNITWEVGKMYNFGLESYLFNYALSLELDFFYEERSNILIRRNASVPNFTGLNLPDENFGIVNNKGVEMMLGYKGRASDFTYNFNAGFTFTRNKVVEFDEPVRNVPWQISTGKPQGSHLLYKYDGIFRDAAHVESLPSVPGARPGDIIIRDVDNDGDVDPNDRVLLPFTEDPEITFNLNSSVTYKSIAVTFLFQGVENAVRNVYTDTRQGTAGNYFRYDVIDRWNPQNIDASKPRAFDKVEEYWRASYLTDYGFHKLGYARLKNVQVAYTIPEKVTKLLSLEQAQVFISGQNIFLVYNKNKIFDPEVSNTQTYPLMRTFSIGGNLIF